MSNSHPTTTSTAASATSFQLIFNNALKAYKRRTKTDLLSHPLAVELQNCNSPSAILAVLHQKVQVLDQSQSSDDRWAKWLDPIVNVLQTFSDVLGEGVGLVSVTHEMNFVWDLKPHGYSKGVLTWKGDICWSRGPPISKKPS